MAKLQSYMSQIWGTHKKIKDFVEWLLLAEGPRGPIMKPFDLTVKHIMYVEFNMKKKQLTIKWE